MEYKDLVDVCKDAMASTITLTTPRDPTSPIQFSIPKINKTRTSPKSLLHTHNPAALGNGGSKSPQRYSKGHAPAVSTQKLESSGPPRLCHQSSVTIPVADEFPLFIPLSCEQSLRYRHGDLRPASNTSSLSHENPARNPRRRRNKQEKRTAIKKLTSIPRGKGRRDNDTKRHPRVTNITLSLLDSSQGALEALTTSTNILSLEPESRRGEFPMSPLVIRGRFYEDRIVEYARPCIHNTASVRKVPTLSLTNMTTSTPKRPVIVRSKKPNEDTVFRTDRKRIPTHSGGEISRIKKARLGGL